MRRGARPAGRWPWLGSRDPDRTRARPSPARPHRPDQVHRVRTHGVAVHCPWELAHIMLRAGGLWQPGLHHWLVERRRTGPVIRVQTATDQLFRRAGVSLD
jgi:hypothetical protein